MANKAIGYIIGIIIILAIIYVAIGVITPKPISTVTSTVSPSVSTNGTVALMLTDPAQVPEGTTALNITFSNAELHESQASNSTGFVNVNTTGTINLLSLVNVSQTLGIASINRTKDMNLIILNVSSSSITINGTVYNVTLPSKKVIIHISNFNGTSGAALIDFSPSIVQIISTNQTIFVMVPSVKAVVVGSGNVSNSSIHKGVKVRLNATLHARLNLGRPNITITSASLSESNNTTALSVTVRNNGNSSVNLNHMLLYGLMYANFTNGIRASVQVRPTYDLQGFSGLGISSIISEYSNSSYNISSLFNALASKYGANFSKGFSASASAALKSHNISGILKQLSNSSINISAIASNYSEFNKEFGLNVSSSEFNVIRANMQNKDNLSIMRSLNNFNLSSPYLHIMLHGAAAFNTHYHNVLSFIINSNGTLSLPFDARDAEAPVGYSLAPNSSATFKFNGNISFGNGRINIAPIQNQSYSIRIMGNLGAFTSTNVTAG